MTGQGLIKGLATTLTHAFARKPVTIQYPEQRRWQPPRLRWRHNLHRYEDPQDPRYGMERCIGCALCAAACPAEAIWVEAADNDPENPHSPGERHASVYEINMLRCIFCGYCEESCPTDAIRLGADFELAESDRSAFIYGKDRLLLPDPREQQQAQELAS